MADEDLDRNEAATPYKLEKARQRGQVARSTDCVSVAVLTVAAAWLYWGGLEALHAQFRYDRALLANAGRVDAGGAAALLARIVTDALLGLLPWFAALAITGVAANLVQTGVVCSAHPLKPDVSRLNPAAGFKRLLSMRTLFDGARAVAKLALLGLVTWHAVSGLVPAFPRLAAMPAAQLARTLLDHAGAAGLQMAFALGLVAAMDVAYSRREFLRRMRMSRRELKDEHKNREGDPRIRARLRQLRREALRRSMSVRDTARADVVLTNPTHLAVALRYAESEMSAPQVIAKGAGAVASAMRQVAALHRIPVVPNPPLARALFHELDVEQPVPPARYAEVARILVWVFAMRAARRGAAA